MTEIQRNFKKQRVLGDDSEEIRKDEQELELEAELFNDSHQFGKPEDDMSEDEPFFIDESKPSQAEALWEDEDDKNFEISLASNAKLRKLRKEEGEDIIGGDELESRLREKFKAINPTPSWATQAKNKRKQREDESEDEDDILNSTDLNTLTNRKTRLKAGEIKVERLKDVVQSDQINIVNVEFHPIINNLLLVAQSDRRLKIYNVEGSKSTLVQQLHLKDMPITTAIFNPTKPSIFIGGPRPYSYIYHLEDGSVQRFKHTEGVFGTHAKFNIDGTMIALKARRGYVELLRWTNSSCVPIGNVKMNRPAVDFAWGRNSNTIYIITDNSEMSIWDAARRRCIRTWKDSENFSPSTIAVSRDNTFISVGYSSGIVNIYEVESLKLLKSLGNLTTSINNLAFNKDTQLLASTSAEKNDQLRLIHLPSLTVYQNWPTSNTPLGKVQAIDFSTDGRWIVIANQKGKLLLYHVRHYSEKVAY
ncbi:WD40 repeat-like protein [Wallemia mellicola]|nr:WD40 repeat-like protein [Wallemia mellicola]TIC20522.1 WD40 repeat-like protein [Wallemia mellicola]